VYTLHRKNTNIPKTKTHYTGRRQTYQRQKHITQEEDKHTKDKNTLHRKKTNIPKTKTHYTGRRQTYQRQKHITQEEDKHIKDKNKTKKTKTKTKQAKIIKQNKKKNTFNTPKHRK
jgi:hypothetical protein